MWMFRCRECGELIGPEIHAPADHGYRHTTCDPSHDDVIAAYEQAIENDVDRRLEERHV